MSHECYMNVTFRFCFRSPLKSLKLPVFKGLSTDLGSHSFLHISFYPLYFTIYPIEQKQSIHTHPFGRHHGLGQLVSPYSSTLHHFPIHLYLLISKKRDMEEKHSFLNRMWKYANIVWHRMLSPNRLLCISM